MDLMTPIRDIIAEKIVAGTLINSKSYYDVEDVLTEECFTEPKYLGIFKAVKEICKEGNTPDIMTVKSRLDKLGCPSTYADITDIAMSHTFDLRQNCIHLKELEARRGAFSLGYYLMQNGTSEVNDLSDVSSKIEDYLKKMFEQSESGIKTAEDYTIEVYEQIKENISNNKSIGTMTGFSEIDSRGGLQPSNLILIAASSSQGKTSFATAIADNATKSGEKVAYYSLEMTGCQLVSRMASSISGVPYIRIQNSPLTIEELRKVQTALCDIKERLMYFDDRSNSRIDNIISSIRTLKIKKNIGGVIIDYIQILSINQKGEREEQLAEIARRLKNLAKELNIWIIVLSQLNRNADNPEPTVDRLRGSGQINEAADMTILIYRPEVYGKKYPKPFDYTDTKGTALIDVAKGRNIGTFKFIAGFEAETTKFYQLTERPIKVEEEPF